MNIMVVYREKQVFNTLLSHIITNKQENNVCTPLLTAANSPAVKKIIVRNITKWVSLDEKKACENMINKHSWLHRLDSDRHRLRSFSGSQTVGHTVTTF